MDLYYQCSDGTKIDFMDEIITAENPESLIKNNWKYKTVSGVNGLGKVKNFYKESVERNLTINVLTDSKAEFNEIMYRLHKCFEKDIRTLQAGRIYWNDFYKEVFIFSTSPSDFDETFETVNQELTILCVRDFWIKETVYNFFEQSSNENTDLGIDFPFDFGLIGFDYLLSDKVEIINNDCINTANFEIKFFGPCSNPSVIINGHEYEIQNLELENGEYVKINSINKKILKYSKTGIEENIFHLRNRDSYIFEPISAGVSHIIRTKSMPISITIFDERGEPVWI